MFCQHSLQLGVNRVETPALVILLKPLRVNRVEAFALVPSLLLRIQLRGNAMVWVSMAAAQFLKFLSAKGEVESCEEDINQNKSLCNMKRRFCPGYGFHSLALRFFVEPSLGAKMRSNTRPCSSCIKSEPYLLAMVDFTRFATASAPHFS